MVGIESHPPALPFPIPNSCRSMSSIYDECVCVDHLARHGGKPCVYNLSTFSCCFSDLVFRICYYL